MPAAKHKARTPQTTVDMKLVRQVVDSLPKGSDELRQLRNAVWKKIAEPSIPEEAITEQRDYWEKYGEEIAKKAISKVKKEYKDNNKVEAL